MGAKDSQSLNNFLWDIFVRSFECKDALYEDCSSLNDSEKHALIESYLRNVNIWQKIYDERISFIKTNVHLCDGKKELCVEEVSFHPKCGWTVSNGATKAFLGKVSFYENVKISIGHRSYFSGNGIIRGDDLLQVGNYCAIAEGCYINVFRDSHPVDYPSLHGFQKSYRTEEDRIDLPVKYVNLKKDKLGVTIGSDVWFGRNVRVFHGVNIPDGCVIAEGSLVKKDCEPYGIYAGIPAKHIRFRFPKRTREQLLEIQWWNWPFSKIKKNATFFDTDLTSFKGDLTNLIVDE